MQHSTLIDAGHRVVWVGAWILLLLVAILTLLPEDLELRTRLPGMVEHMIAYVVVGVAFSINDPRRWIPVALSLAGFGAALEVLQSFSFGREPDMLDAASNGLGAFVGTATMRLGKAWLRWAREES